jgi:hypothetical protein
MAITNAQQFKQLVNPPMKGNKRPGYRGDDAYGGGRDPSGTTGVGDGDTNRERGMQRSRNIAQARADARVAAGLGDPDPNVDKPIDTITSFVQNLNAARKANPLLATFSLFNPMFAIPTIAKTAFQTGKARSMLGLQNPGPPGITRGEGDGPVPYWAQLGFSSEAEYLASLRAQVPSTEEQETEEEPFQLSRRFRAEGGIINADVVGGEFDFESARQMYGLGKLVKKVTKTVKKIAKSDLGKAAILAAGGYYLGGGAIGPFQRAGMSGFKFANLPGAGFFAKSTPVKLAAGVPDRLAFNAARTAAGSSSGSLLNLIGGKVGAGILGASAIAGLLTPEQEEEAQDLARGEGIDIDAARNAILAARQDDFRARRFRAEGGSMKEPVAKKTMPLLDLDGKEMDLRAEGGFVPIGRMEKADDVPARLSKNEFVFTADAVRNAGDGNVDKGAEVMYNMMKNLEAGGEVSKESQGLEGARRMFQTSKRLEEVL